MTTLREKCIRAIIEGYEEGLMADEVFDAILAVLGEHANEWDTGDVYQQEMFRKNQGVFWIIPVEGLLADPEEDER